MGWVMLGLLAAASAVLLWRLRVAPALWSLVGAAIMLGAIGYSVQGRPGLAGVSAEGQRERRTIDPGLKELRQAMFGRFNFEETYFVAADALLSAGNPAAAAQVMMGGVQKAPQSAALWTWLGMMLVEKDGGTLSPAAKLAFEQGLRLAPKHPGPAFFYGLAQARTDDFGRSRALWLRALERTPKGVSYRQDIAMRLVLVDRLIALRASERAAGAGQPSAR
ncbi:tetratricopeptide repeat protein [Sphingomonas sp. ac-8]|uniref:tetratricopeptide repeat protein n=1 Tax=Sphingomonas sp. ac-8 TaxID=3242977 RepID=UPI003A80A9EF